MDIDVCQGTMEGIKLEIEDSAFDLVDHVTITTNVDDAFKECNVAILLG